MQKLDFTSFPILRSENYILRQLKETDVNEIFILRSEAVVLEFIGRLPITELSEASAFIEQVNTGIQNRESLLWGITSLKSDTITGTICLWNVDQESSKADIGYVLLPQHFRKGIMREVMAIILDFGFTNLKLKQIDAEVHELNQPSIRLLNLFGFQYMGNGIDEHFICYTKNRNEEQ